jgi:hypothetical protein
MGGSSNVYPLVARIAQRMNVLNGISSVAIGRKLRALYLKVTSRMLSRLLLIASL